MDLNALGILGAALVAGWVIQSLVRLKPIWNFWVTFLTILIFAPIWSIGFTVGIWLCCAFLTYHSDVNSQNEASRSRVWVFVDALFTFSGFLLTLLLLWKVKSNIRLPLTFQHEVGAWLYFITVEICFYRIIALNYPYRKRFAIGYEIGFYNTLMVLYWIYPYGWEAVVLTFITILVLNPLLLLWLDRPSRPADGIPLGGDQ